MLRLMAPAVPHITAELWQLRHAAGAPQIHVETWPTADPAMLVVSEVTMIVQVNGKVRDRIEVPAEISDADAEALALASAAAQGYLTEAPKKVIVRAPKLVNIVA